MEAEGVEPDKESIIAILRDDNVDEEDQPDAAERDAGLAVEAGPAREAGLDPASGTGVEASGNDAGNDSGVNVDWCLTECANGCGGGSPGAGWMCVYCSSSPPTCVNGACL
jgi:hypothetical protein